MRGISIALVASLLTATCGGAPTGLQAATSSARSPAASTTEPSPVSPPSPSGSAPAPLSSGAVPEAGVLYVWGGNDGIYRYDGTTGSLTRIWGASTPSRESAYGPYVLGRHGGTTLLRWDGTTQQVCGGGNWSVVSTRGDCAFTGAGADAAVYTDSPEGGAGAPLPRMLLPADWGAGLFAWDWNGLELAVVRNEARPRPSLEVPTTHQSVWVLDLRHGTLRRVFDSSHTTSWIWGLAWSPDRRISFWESTSTSNSFAADGVGISLHMVNVDSAVDRDLGTTLGKAAWARWSSDGRLVFVSGGGRATWDAKQVKVLIPDGSVQVLAGDGASRPTSVSAVAPAWQPVFRSAAIAWIEGPSVHDLSGLDYVAGRGPGERVAIVEGSGDRVRVACPDRVTEGVRLSADATSALLLCRVPGVDQNPFELWYTTLGGTPRPLVTSLGGTGFGYYGAQPSLFDITAWSLADR